MDPLQVPLWRFLYQGLQDTWLLRIAYGCETFVLPLTTLELTTVLVAELTSQLRSRNIDWDRSRNSGTNLPQKEATQQMAKEVVQLMQAWLPTQPAAADSSSQQRILDLEMKQNWPR